MTIPHPLKVIFSHWNKFKALLCAALFFAAGMSVALPGQAGSVVELSPHRAVYDLSLDKATDRSGIANIFARLVYEIKGSSCEGYTLNINLVSTLVSRGGKKYVTDIRISSFEGDNGELYQYSSQQYLNQARTKKFRGSALKSEGKVKLAQEEPDKKLATLPDDTYFPNTHLVKVLLSAKEGERLLQTHYFDGSDGANPFRVSTIIGKGKVPGSVKFKHDIPANERLKPLASWPIIMSFFETDEKTGGDQTPVYEMSLHMFENGVSSLMKLSYPDFSMSGHMKELEFFPPSTCE